MYKLQESNYSCNSTCRDFFFDVTLNPDNEVEMTTLERQQSLSYLRNWKAPMGSLLRYQQLLDVHN